MWAPTVSGTLPRFGSCCINTPLIIWHLAAQIRGLFKWPVTAGGDGAVVALVPDGAMVAQEGFPGLGERPQGTHKTPAKGGPCPGLRREHRGVEGAPSGSRR